MIESHSNPFLLVPTNKNFPFSTRLPPKHLRKVINEAEEYESPIIQFISTGCRRRLYNLPYQGATPATPATPDKVRAQVCWISSGKESCIPLPTTNRRICFLKPNLELNSIPHTRNKAKQQLFQTLEKPHARVVAEAVPPAPMPNSIPRGEGRENGCGFRCPMPDAM